MLYPHAHYAKSAGQSTIRPIYYCLILYKDTELTHHKGRWEFSVELGGFQICAAWRTLRTRASEFENNDAIRRINKPVLIITVHLPDT